MTTETSNARGEVVAWRYKRNGIWNYTETPQRGIEHEHGFDAAEALYTEAQTVRQSGSEAWQATIDRIVPEMGQALEGEELLCCERHLSRDRERIRLELSSLAPPPAAARGDVRGLVAKWERDALVNVLSQGERAVLRNCTSALRDAIAAEGVHCDSCNGSGVVVTYVDPYERGDVSSPEQSPCPDCAEGVQAGEVEQRARVETALRDALAYVGQRQDGDLPVLAERCELWMRESQSLLQNLSQQPEARGVVDGESVEDEYLSLLDWLFKERGHSNDDPIYSAFSAFVPKLQTLTGERNG